MLFGTSGYNRGLSEASYRVGLLARYTNTPPITQKKCLRNLDTSPRSWGTGGQSKCFLSKTEKSNFSISSMFFIRFGSFLCLTWGIRQCRTQCRTLEDCLTLFSILFVVPSKKPYEWAEGMKKWAEGPLTRAIALGIPKNPILDPKIIKIWFREQKLWPFKIFKIVKKF